MAYHRNSMRVKWCDKNFDDFGNVLCCVFVVFSMSSSFPMTFPNSSSAPLAYRSYMKYEIFMSFDNSHFLALFPSFQANAAFFLQKLQALPLFSTLHF